MTAAVDWGAVERDSGDDVPAGRSPTSNVLGCIAEAYGERWRWRSTRTAA